MMVPLALFDSFGLDPARCESVRLDRESVWMVTLGPRRSAVVARPWRPRRPTGTLSRGMWSVYLVRTAQGELYTGIALDVARRCEQHAAGVGAKYLRGRGPLSLCYRRRVGDHGLALRVERRIKALARDEKETLVRGKPSRARLLKRLGLEPGDSSA